MTLDLATNSQIQFQKRNKRKKKTDKLDFVKIKKNCCMPEFIIEKGKRHRWEIMSAITIAIRV